MLQKAYDPQATEDRIYEMWERSGAFIAESDSDKEPFTISMPPPNATGQLHLGHAVMLALEDIFVRFARMQGKEALWVPGTDHAAIATENVVIQKLQAEGIKDPREHLGREKLLEEIKTFVEHSQDTIRSQVRKMGSSCDWSRERYTMDAALSRCVNEVFTKMYTDDLIYRGHRIVNWDPKLQTNVSDDEMEWVERTAPFYTFQYGPFQIGTVRPETKFGDKYVVVHPDDKRYAKWKHGDTFECEWINGPIAATVVKDESIDPEFGTGCMTITPWHTAVDFEIAERHSLDKEQVIDFEGKLLPIAGEFEGMSIEEARPKIVEKLKEKGLLVKVDEQYRHTVAVNSRGGGTIEPQIKLQWFIDVNKKAVQWKGKERSLKEVMQEVVRSGDIQIIPEKFEKVYFHWIDNLRDWCISRQIWWGHRIPVWYCVGDDHCKLECKNPILAVQPPAQCPVCGSSFLVQDSDTLDTWFSSALWTWSTLVDPKLTEDYSLTLKEILQRSPDVQRFHPTQVMETGYDILFFWVARMILMTTYATGQLPFEKVYLHGLVRTREGKKMSKSDPSSCIDPLEIIPKYGADALRLSMIVGQSPGNDFRLYEEKIAGYRNFVNKLWNASRFVLMICEKEGVDPKKITYGCAGESLADKALLTQLQHLVADVTEGLKQYRLSEVGERLYSFVWDEFCDWHLEYHKTEPNAPLLVHALRTILVLLHPYCPFVTEELWSALKAEESGMLMTQPWPVADLELQDQKAAEHFSILAEVISAIRQLRSEYNVEPAKYVDVILVTRSHGTLLNTQIDHIKRLVRAEQVTIQQEPYSKQGSASAFTKHIEVHLPLAGLVDIEKERTRLTAEQAKLEAFLQGITAKLESSAFVQNAPDAVVEKERDKERDARARLDKVQEKLSAL